MTLFNIIKNENKYWLVDQIERDHISIQEYKKEFEQILANWKENDIGYLSLLVDEDFEEWLFDLKFRKISTTVEYTKEINDEQYHGKLRYHSLADELMREEEYAELYEKSRQGTANKNEQQAMSDVMQSIKKEL
ncbi:hypothetical protein ACLIA0_12665 [Bacillaceae bacterium W0354]